MAQWIQDISCKLTHTDSVPFPSHIARCLQPSTSKLFLLSDCPRLLEFVRFSRLWNKLWNALCVGICEACVNESEPCKIATPARKGKKKAGNEHKRNENSKTRKNRKERADIPSASRTVGRHGRSLWGDKDTRRGKRMRVTVSGPWRHLLFQGGPASEFNHFFSPVFATRSAFSRRRAERR